MYPKKIGTKGYSHDSSIRFSPHYEAKWLRLIFCRVENVFCICFFPGNNGRELNFIPWRRWILYLEKKQSVPLGNSVLHTLKMILWSDLPPTRNGGLTTRGAKFVWWYGPKFQRMCFNRSSVTHSDAQTVCSFFCNVELQNRDVSGQVRGGCPGQGGSQAMQGGHERAHSITTIQPGVEAPRWTRRVWSRGITTAPLFTLWPADSFVPATVEPAVGTHGAFRIPGKIRHPGPAAVHLSS